MLSTFTGAVAGTVTPGEGDGATTVRVPVPVVHPATNRRTIRRCVRMAS
jgi:hypothetical protein